ncbi:MAG: FkbM family methyltransferase [Leptolyngbyaceae cyanobacterium bins.349]|nr:FkbM family methyltransferase [Leptolyngbyaceae cyanobacterium bins.349]
MTRSSIPPSLPPPTHPLTYSPPSTLKSQIQHSHCSLISMATAIATQLTQAQQFFQAGDLAAAEVAYQQVVAQDPQHLEAWFWLALIADQLGRTSESIARYETVLQIQPNSAEAHGNLGSVLLKLRRLDEAVAHHRKSTEFAPTNAKAHYNLAIALYENNQIDEAIQSYQRAIERMPDYANAHHNLGMALYRQGKADEAITHYQQAIALEPGHASARNSLGVALYQQGKLDDAIAQYRQAIALMPHYISAHDNLGIALKQQRQLEAAAEHFRTAIALNPAYVNAYINLGNTMRELGDYHQAIAYCQESIRLQPTNADAHNTYGCILVDLGRLQDAIACYEAAIQHRPDFADAHLNLGIILLQVGDFQRGFAEYHWRWQTKQCPDLRYTHALWKGEDLTRKIILLTAEQGFGDTIQFARYATLVAQRGGKVVIACQKPLVRLLATVPGVAQCVDRDQDNVETHVHAPLMELPYVLGTTLETIPATVPYVFPPAAAPIQLHIPPDTHRKIGFVWATNPSNSTSGKRSCPVEHFLTLLDVPHIALYSLQKDASDADRALLQGHDRLQDIQAQLEDFADTAAAIAQLDLVITVDTAVAHLAGAMGKPTWILLAHVPDWRWLMEREDSPWYPTMRLFRQHQPDAWAEVFERVKQALAAPFPSSPPPPLPSPSAPVRPSPPSAPVHPSPTPPSPSLPLSGFNRIKQCRHGFFLHNVNDLTVGRSLDLYGEWSEGDINLYKTLIQLGNTVVEVGANIGAHTVFLAKTVGLNGKVFAIEPQRLNFQMLCANLALNSITNTHSYQIALDATPGFIPLSTLSGYHHHINLSHQQEQVQTATLDSFGIPQCRLIKFDVGEMLGAVLQGASQTLQQCQPMVYVVSDLPPLAAALSTLLRHGYCLYYYHPPLYDPGNFFQNPRNVFGSTTLHNILGFHQSHNITVNGLERYNG